MAPFALVVSGTLLALCASAAVACMMRAWWDPWTAFWVAALLLGGGGPAWALIFVGLGEGLPIPWEWPRAVAGLILSVPLTAICLFGPYGVSDAVRAAGRRADLCREARASEAGRIEADRPRSGQLQRALDACADPLYRAGLGWDVEVPAWTRPSRAPGKAILSG